MALVATVAGTVFVGATTVQAIYAIASLTSIYLGYVVWQHREKTGALPLLVAIVGGWWWSTTLFLQTVLSSYVLSVAFLRANYLGIVVSVAAIFLFTLEYTGREHLVDRRTIALLSLEPVAVAAIVVIDPGEFFFALSPEPARVTGVEVDFGLGFLLHTVYSYGLVFVASALIVGMVYRTRAMYRGQLAVLVGAVLLPLIPNAIAIFRLVNFDATPVGFLVANALYTVAITRYRLIDLAPIARDRVVNSLNSAVFVVDTEDRIVDANPAGATLAEEFVGESDMIGEDARDLLDLVPEMSALYADIVAHEMERTVEYEIGGGYYLADATPIEDARDRIVGWVFVIRDITARKRREEQLQERNDQLDKFASVVSHDLRNPLQVASGRVEITRTTGDTTHLDAAETALDRMETIIDDVLALARSGDTVTDLAPIAIADAAETAWETVDPDDATLVLETDSRVTADRDRLVRLLENLFRNAVEHGSTSPPSSSTQEDGPGRGASSEPTAADAPEDPIEREVDDALGTRADAGVEGDGGGTHIREPTEGGTPGTETSDGTPISGRAGDPALTVTIRLLTRDGRSVGFSVADDGRGIPPEERESIFESGYSTTDGGTGFGLTIVSQIADAHGWTVRATESDDGGACFEFTGVEVVNS